MPEAPTRRAYHARRCARRHARRRARRARRRAHPESHNDHSEGVVTAGGVGCVVSEGSVAAAAAAACLELAVAAHLAGRRRANRRAAADAVAVDGHTVVVGPAHGGHTPSEAAAAAAARCQAQDLRKRRA
jgi:hypothetical protein